MAHLNINMSQAFDENGNEVFPTTVHTICPIEYAATARQIALDFINSQHGEETLENMLNIELREIGGESVTHILCSRNDYTHGRDKQLAWLNNENHSWICADNHDGSLEANHVKTKFCTISGITQSELLSLLNLEVCN